MTVKITSELHDLLIMRAARSPGHEICGLLFGEQQIDRSIAVKNVAQDRPRAFEIDPVPLFEAIRAERVGGPRLLGYYHSHPRGAPTASHRDHAQSAGDGRVWLIIAGAEITAWRATSLGFLSPDLLEVLWR